MSKYKSSPLISKISKYYYDIGDLPDYITLDQRIEWIERYQSFSGKTFKPRKDKPLKDIFG